MARGEIWTKERIKKTVESYNLILVDIPIFSGKKSELIVKCLNNDHKPFNILLSNLLRRKNTICKECEFEEKVLEAKEYVESFGYKFIRGFMGKKYNNAKSECFMIEIQCNEGHKPYITPFSRFKSEEVRCKICKTNIKVENWTLSLIIKYVEDRGYIFIDLVEGSGWRSLIKIRCNNLNHKPFNVRFGHFIEGQRCKFCNESKGENKISNILFDNNIFYEREYTYDDCRSVKPLPFDFYIPDYNILIEYDGELHYKIVKRFGGLDKFISNKIHDTIKTWYCEQNDIKLIRIPYWDFDNIEKILKQELNLI